MDPADRSILVFRPGQQPELLLGNNHPSVLEDINLELTVYRIFGWLKMSDN
ncbi:hypothetical protein [Moorena sp. SIO4A1]|uniref:hypothetical protein n=1 Tax=Moorena sp. SIO4A1 TaxID=2607835 RepID=UPI0025FA1328|nr:MULTISPECIES: hypothetical protein [unclassified Moorena]